MTWKRAPSPTHCVQPYRRLHHEPKVADNVEREVRCEDGEIDQGVRAHVVRPSAYVELLGWHLSTGEAAPRRSKDWRHATVPYGTRQPARAQARDVPTSGSMHGRAFTTKFASSAALGPRARVGCAPQRESGYLAWPPQEGHAVVAATVSPNTKLFGPIAKPRF